MSQTISFFSRLTQWWQGSSKDTLPLERRAHDDAAQPTRAWRLRLPRLLGGGPSRQAMLQQSVGALNDLMLTIRDNLVRQNQRQDDILACLSQMVESLPESQRTQAEALAAIGQQIQQQVAQQQQMTGIFDKISQSHEDQQRLMGQLQGGMTGLAQHDEAIAQNLQQVGSAMQSVSRSSECSAAVLQRLHEDLAARDRTLETMLHRHNVRLTIILAIGAAVSLAAILTTGAIGYLVLHRH